jgi:hypothetical protein
MKTTTVNLVQCDAGGVLVGRGKVKEGNKGDGIWQMTSYMYMKQNK